MDAGVRPRDPAGLLPRGSGSAGGGAFDVVVVATVDPAHEAAQLAAEGTTPPSDLNGAADYRQHLARVLTGRAVLKAAGA